MFQKFIILFAVLNEISISQQAEPLNSYVVSTTEASSDTSNDNKLSKQVAQLVNTTSALETKLNELLRRLDQLETNQPNTGNGLPGNPINETPKPGKSYPQNCLDARQQGHLKTGVYLIQPKLAPRPFPVLCEMSKKGGGWAYILRRVDGSVDFDLGWRDYKQGFGNLSGEFWLGLKNIHYLTGRDGAEMLVEVVDDNNKQIFAHYDSFGIEDEEDGFRLSILRGYSGDAGPNLDYYHGCRFSTKDNDQDLDMENCALQKTGGWWFYSCTDGHLTGIYGDSSTKGAYWDIEKPFKEVRILLRSQPKIF